MILLAFAVSTDYWNRHFRSWLHASAHQPYQAQEQYLAVWLTTFCYAFLMDPPRADPYVEARKDVDYLYDDRRYRSASEHMGVFPRSNSDWGNGHHSWTRNLFGPCRVTFGNAQSLDASAWYHGTHVPKFGPGASNVSEHCCCMDRRYNDLVDLYAAWFELHPAKMYYHAWPEFYDKYLIHLGEGYRDMPKVIEEYDKSFQRLVRSRKTYPDDGSQLYDHPQYNGYRKIHGKEFRSYKHELYIDSTTPASLFDIRFVPGPVHRYYGEMQKLLADFQRKYHIKSCRTRRKYERY